MVVSKDSESNILEFFRDCFISTLFNSNTIHLKDGVFLRILLVTVQKSSVTYSCMECVKKLFNLQYLKSKTKGSVIKLTVFCLLMPVNSG